MRILHVIPGVARRYGGPSTVIGPLVAALNRLPDITAEIATTDADGPGGRLTTSDTPAGITTHLFRRGFSERWKYSRELGRWLDIHAGDYDIIHVHALWSYPSSAAAVAARRASVPYIVRPAGMLSPYTWGRGAWKKRLYWRLFERKTVFGAAAFHATSIDEANEIRAVRPEANVVVIPNGVEDCAFTAPVNPNELRRRCGPAADGRPILLFLSRLHPKKGLTDLLLPAIARNKRDAFLAIVGGEDEHAHGYEAEVRQTIARLRLSDCVGLLGPIEAGERWPLFDGADVFVLPSHSENFGIVVAEAMARGCPVLVTHGVQSHEHVTRAGAGLVVPATVAAVTDGLDRLLVGDRDATRERGRAYARVHFDWDRIAEQLASVYRGLLRGQS